MSYALSSDDLPMFFDEAHVRLSENRAKVRTADPRLSDVGEVAARMAELGLFEHLVPRGDVEVSVRSLCLIREALAYGSPLADAVFAVQGLGSHPVVLAAGYEGQAAFLEKVRNGASIGGFALTEPEAGSDVASMQATAERTLEGWTLDGEKTFISNVGIAHHFVVFARVQGDFAADPKKSISAFLVPASAPGLALEPIATSGHHPLGRLLMRGCKVSGDALLGKVGQGMRLALGTLDVFRTSVGAAAVGMARRALDDTLAHVRSRVQFGKRLADQQLTQAALADMATELDAARLLVFRAAWKKDKGEKASVEVAEAKLFATEAAQRIIDRAVQLHGGLGVVSGTFVEKLYREIRPLRIYEGTSEIQRLIIGSALSAQ